MITCRSRLENARLFLFSCVWGLSYFFFFQAEDGIRDLYVTGVQTCALPISLGRGAERQAPPVRRRGRRRRGRRAHAGGVQARVLGGDQDLPAAEARQRRRDRSEERRVGKECRSRWSPDH